MKHLPINQFYEWIKVLAKKDSLDFDFHGFYRDENKILFQKKELQNYSHSESQHINLRLLQGEKAGTSYTKDFSKESLEDCYRRALDALRLSDKKEGGDLSQKGEYKDFSSFYDESIDKTPIDKKIEKAREMNKACWSASEKIQPMYSSVSDLSDSCFFANSKGLQHSYNRNAVLVFCVALAIEEKSRAEGYSQFKAQSYKEIDFAEKGQEAAGKALKKLNYVIPKTKRYPVIFQAGSAAGSLLSRLADLLNGKTIYEGLSLFKDSLNKKIFSDSFSFYDDPFVSWGASSRPFDGEGFAMERTSLVEKGVLSNYLTSSFFAKALKAPHTKKAYWSEEASLNVSSTNLVMEEGTSSFEELTKDFPQVLIVDRLKGWAGYNPISGDFSIESEGFLFEKGEFQALCQFVVSGNIKDIFSRILKVGKDSSIYYGSFKAPSFLVPDLMIAGQ